MSCSVDILEELVDYVTPTVGEEGVAGCHTHTRANPADSANSALFSLIAILVLERYI